MSGAEEDTPELPQDSNQQIDVISENEENSINKLKEMIEDLQNKNSEFEKTNQTLIENTESLNKEIEAKQKEINDKKEQYQQLLDNPPPPPKKLPPEEQQIADEYLKYKSRVNTAKEIKKDNSFFSQEMTKYQQDISTIQKDINGVVEKYPDSEKKVSQYKALLALVSKLDDINNLFINEAKNCISAGELDPELFEATHLEELKGKIDKGEEIKRGLSLEPEQIKSTEDSVNNMSSQLERCLPIYNQVFLIVTTKTEMIDKPKDKNEDQTLESRDPNLQYSFVYDNTDTECTENDDISELKRISQIDQFDYLSDPTMSEIFNNLKKFSALIEIPEISEKNDETMKDIVINEEEEQKESNNTKLTTDPLNALLNQPGEPNQEEQPDVTTKSADVEKLEQPLTADTVKDVFANEKLKDQLEVDPDWIKEINDQEDQQLIVENPEWVAEDESFYQVTEQETPNQENTEKREEQQPEESKPDETNLQPLSTNTLNALLPNQEEQEPEEQKQEEREPEEQATETTKEISGEQEEPQPETDDQKDKLEIDPPWIKNEDTDEINLDDELIENPEWVIDDEEAEKLLKSATRTVPESEQTAQSGSHIDISNLKKLIGQDQQNSSQLPPLQQSNTKQKAVSTRTPRPYFKKKEPFVSTYDPSIFYTPLISTESASLSTTTVVRGKYTDPPPLTVTLKDIGLEGLDSPVPDKTQQIKMLEDEQKEKERKSKRRTRNDESGNLIESASKSTRVVRPVRSPIKSGETQFGASHGSKSPRRKRAGSRRKVVEPLEVTLTLANETELDSNGNPRPPSLLSSTQSSSKPQTVIPKTGPKANSKSSRSNSRNGSAHEEPTQLEDVLKVMAPSNEEESLNERSPRRINSPKQEEQTEQQESAPLEELAAAGAAALGIVAEDQPAPQEPAAENQPEPQEPEAENQPAPLESLVAIGAGALVAGAGEQPTSQE